MFFTYIVAVRWLQSATIMLLPDNQSIYISCNVTESTPTVKCLARLNCSICDEVTSEVFIRHTEISVMADTDYHISVLVVESQNSMPLENYSIVETVSVPKLTPEPNLTPLPQPSLTQQPEPTEHPEPGTSCKF